MTHQRGDRVVVPRGAVLLLAALIVSVPAVNTLAGPYRVNSQSLVKHRHTDVYGVKNSVGPPDAVLRQKVDNAREEWDARLGPTSRSTVRLVEDTQSPEILAERASYPDNNFAAIWDAGFHPSGATELVFNAAKVQGMSASQKQGVACRALGGILGLETAGPSRGDCMSDSENSLPGAESANLVDAFYGPNIEFSGRLHEDRADLSSRGIYKLVATADGHAVRSIVVKVDGVQVAAAGPITCAERCQLPATATVGPLTTGQHTVTASVTNEFGRTPPPRTFQVTVNNPLDWGFADRWITPVLVDQIDDSGGAPNGIGATTNRLEVRWDNVESCVPTRDGDPEHEYDFADYRPAYEAMLSAGQRPILMLSTSPPWAWTPRGTEPRQCPPGDPSHYRPPHPDFDEDWSSFAKAAIQEFPEVKAIQVWNEPNITRFWYVDSNSDGVPEQPNPSRYAEIFDRAKLAAMQVYPNPATRPPVITAGLVGPPYSGDIEQRDYLDIVYAQADQAFDGIGVHSYPRGSSDEDRAENFATSIRQLRNVREDSIPLWVTETGISTSTAAQQDATVSEAAQGVALHALYQEAESMQDVRMFMIFRFRDTNDPNEGLLFRSMGIVREDPAIRKDAFGDVGCLIGERHTFCN